MRADLAAREAAGPTPGGGVGARAGAGTRKLRPKRQDREPVRRRGVLGLDGLRGGGNTCSHGGAAAVGAGELGAGLPAPSPPPHVGTLRSLLSSFPVRVRPLGSPPANGFPGPGLPRPRPGKSSSTESLCPQRTAVPPSPRARSGGQSAPLARTFLWRQAPASTGGGASLPLASCPTA